MSCCTLLWIDDRVFLSLRVLTWLPWAVFAGADLLPDNPALDLALDLQQPLPLCARRALSSV